MKIISWIVFGLAVLAQWAAPLSQIRAHEQTLAKGTLIKLKCHAPDPYDPLRGRYLAVRPEQDEGKLPEGKNPPSGTYVYATLTTGADGLATISGISLEQPTGGDFIKMKSLYVVGGDATIEWPFDRFYLNEKLAPEADKWFAENIRSAKGIVAEVRVWHGHAVLADLTFDGKPFREILKDRVK